MLSNLRNDFLRTLLVFVAMLWLGTAGHMVTIAHGQGRDTDQPKPDFPGLDIQVDVGWDGRIEMNAPVPISFLLSNQSEQVLEGQLILLDPFKKKEINLGDVFIGPGSVRRFSAVQALTGWNDCIAIYTDGGRSLLDSPRGVDHGQRLFRRRELSVICRRRWPSTAVAKS